jgi:hypothetical protein
MSSLGLPLPTENPEGPLKKGGDMGCWPLEKGEVSKKSLQQEEF